MNNDYGQASGDTTSVMDTGGLPSGHTSGTMKDQMLKHHDYKSKKDWDVEHRALHIVRKVPNPDQY